MPVPLLRRAIRRRHSVVDEERGGRVVARHIQQRTFKIQMAAPRMFKCRKFGNVSIRFYKHSKQELK